MSVRDDRPPFFSSTVTSTPYIPLLSLSLSPNDGDLREPLDVVWHIAKRGR